MTRAVSPVSCGACSGPAWDAASTPDRPDALKFSAAETAEPNLGHIVENRVIQKALWERLGEIEGVEELFPREVGDGKEVALGGAIGHEPGTWEQVAWYDSEQIRATR